MRKAQKRKGCWVFFAIFLFFWMAENLLSPYLGLYYVERGLAAMEIGQINVWFSMAIIVSSLVVGALGDKLGRPRRILLLLVLGMILGTFFLYRVDSYMAIALAVLVYGASFAPVNGIADKLLMDRLADRPEGFGKYRMGGTLGAGIGVVLSGALLPMLGFKWLFAGYWLAAAFCGLFIFSLPMELDNVRLDKGGWQDYLQVMRHNRFIPLYMIMAIWGFTEVGVAQFLALHVLRSGLESNYTSLLVGVAMGGEFIGFLIVPWLSRKLRPGQHIALAFVMQVIRMGSLIFLGRVPLAAVCACQFIGGGAYAQVYSLVTQMISGFFCAKVSCSAHTLKLVVNRGIGYTSGYLMMGYLLDRVPSWQAYVVLASCAAGMAIISLLFGQRLLGEAPAGVSITEVT